MEYIGIILIKNGGLRKTIIYKNKRWELSQNKGEENGERENEFYGN